jgi:hypothetical protein
MATLVAEQAPKRRLAVRPIHWLMLGIVVIALTTAGYSLRGGAVVSYASVPEAMASPREMCRAVTFSCRFVPCLGAAMDAHAIDRQPGTLTALSTTTQPLSTRKRVSTVRVSP